MAWLGKAIGALLAGVGVAGTAAAQDAEAPDLDFLEYLGSWQETDEEWLVVAEWEGEEVEERDKSDKPPRNDDE